MAEKVTKPKAAAKPKKAAAPKKSNLTEIPVQAQASAEAEAPSKAAKTGNAPTNISHAEVAKLAHHYFTQRGHKHGHHEDDWFRAEQELRGKAS